MNSKERFEKLLKEMFLGVEIKGDSAIANLLSFKARYYESFIYDITQKIYKTNASQEIYDKLYDFFSSYFNESGSLFFANTPKWQKKYTKLSNKDVELFYKTKDLYYIKTQKVYNPLIIKANEFNIKFIIEDLGNRNGNEKKEIEFLFINFNREKRLVEFKVKYKQQTDYTALKKLTGIDKPEKIRKYLFENRPKEIKYKKNYVFENLDKVKPKDIDLLIISKEKNSLFEDIEVEFVIKDIEAIKKIADTNLKKKLEEEIKEAFKVYKKQNSIDYFIHKNAGDFLKEQFDLYMFEYIKGEIFDESRLRVLKELRDIAYELIDKIARFEDELKAIYLKPRIVFDSNYVITKDRLEKYQILKLFINHSGIEKQIDEWKSLKLVDEDFDISKIDDEKYKFLPFDTKYFKDIEILLLEKIENLDDELDGRLIHSENFQALNTLLPKYRNRIDLIYIDPPYNAKSSEIDYINTYKSSSFLTLIENRINISRFFMKKSSVFFMAIDDYEMDKVSLLLKQYFENLANITVVHNPSGRQDDKFFPVSHEYMLVYALDKNEIKINKLQKSEKKLNEFKYEDEYGRYKLREYRRSGSNSRREDGPGLWYPIYYYPDDKYLTTKKIVNRDNYIKLLPIDNNGIERCWRWGKETFEKKKDKYIEIKKRKNDYVLYVKEREEDYEGDKARTIWSDSKYASANGTNIIKNILNVDNKFFQFPKSVELIKDVIRIGSQKNSFILDFFAGSGTTADAVIRLNKDGGNRKFLLIEMGEHFNNVILPRIKKLSVSLNYKQGIPQDREGNSLFFKYYSLEQYEDILQKARYSNDLETSPKLTYAIKIKDENSLIDLNAIYPDKKIDIAETMSNLIGEKILKITKDKIYLENRVIDLDNFTFEKFPEVKKLIYWE